MLSGRSKCEGDSHFVQDIDIKSQAWISTAMIHVIPKFSSTLQPIICPTLTFDSVKNAPRFSTLQLKSVDSGGYTVFPASFATAVPSKGSVVFWFNTFSDGSPDYSTAHEDCPVVLGQKLGTNFSLFHVSSYSVV